MMNEILGDIREEIGEVNLINSCGGRGCRVDMVDIPSERIIVNVDTAFPAHQIAGKRCDRILVYGDTTQNRLVVAFIELKSGTFKATDVCAQLQASVSLFSNLIPRVLEITCIPILFHGRGVSKLQLKDLNRSPVRFRNQKFPIRLSRCGVPRNLASVLSRSGNL
ncbi:MAG: hypothetical protein OXU36_24965 [Candidatus Poribacteria bacterium]|nr:hypothetical protein [Candidatus Poribacteria bacterium]MYA71215.1 hypothetical protein [Candidatus Poribacteria bacterium]MYH79278.1 hypothetical protein [Candidatus Poribacteria bacterium]MYK94847.1 hypothetical protein [Candidatus Poribacteria bacterium]